MNFTPDDLHRAVAAATASLKDELRKANAENSKLTEECNMLKYAFKVLCGEKLNLRVEISHSELLQQADAYSYLDFAVKRGAKCLAQAALERFADTYALAAENALLKAVVDPRHAYRIDRGL